MDILLLALLAVGFVLGLMSGAVKQIVSLAALVLGFVVASLYCQELSNVLADALPMPDVCRIVAFVLLWVIVILVARLAGALLTSLLDKLLAIGMLNRLLGGILGTAKFALVLGTLIWLLSTTNLISRETMQTSQLCRPLKAMPEYTYNIIKKHAPQAGQEISTCLTRKKGMPNEQ